MKYLSTRVFTTFLTILALFACEASAAEYALLIDGNNTMASEDGNVGGTPYKMTDGSGMNGNPNNDDRILLRWPYDYSPGHPSTWTNTTSSYPSEYQATALLSGAENGKIGWITFDLGAVYELADMYFWNCNDGGGTRGINGFNLYVATNALNIPSAWDQDCSFSSGNGWTQYGDDDANPATPRYTMPMGTGVPTLYNMTVEITNSTMARYIGIEVMTNHGHASRFGLAEFGLIVVDNVSPALTAANITNNTGGSIDVYNPVTYTLTFSEEMNDLSITTADFTNAAFGILVDSITQTATNIFEIIVVPMATGNLTLQVSSNITDWAGNPLAADVTDDETIIVGADSSAPSVLSIEDTLGGTISALGGKVRYKYTFNEHVKLSSFAAGDFENISNAAFTVSSITYGDVNSEIIVDVTLDEVGHVRLRLKDGSVTDMSDNTTAQAWDDDKVITVIQPGLVIHEPFADSDPTLTGNASGVGLTGTWTANHNVIATNLVFGDLISSNNAVQDLSGPWGQGRANIDTTASNYKAIIANGSEMWFSMLINGTTYSRWSFALTDSTWWANGNLNNTDGIGVGFGCTTTKRLYACVWTERYWSTSSNQGTAPDSSTDENQYYAVTNDGLYLVVGHVEWGLDDATDVDRVTLYMPDTDLQLGSPVSVAEGVIDQDKLYLCGYQSGELQGIYDEIRVGATYADVIPIPPPAGTVMIIR